MSKRATLIIHEGPSPGTELVLSGDKIIIGREPPADILLPAQGVSRKHAQIIEHNGRHLIQDLGSTNGTFLNGQRLNAATALKTGDKIGLGRSVLLEYRGAKGVLEPKPAPPETAAARPAAPPAAVAGPQPPDSIPAGAQTVLGEMASPEDAPPPQLVVTVAGSAPRTYTLTAAQYTIGRLENNDIVVESKIVSRQHARLERTPDGGYRLVVLPTVSNPVWLDGRPVSASVRLRHNTRLRIGSVDPGTMVTMTYLSPAEAMAEEVKIEFGDKTIIQIGRDPGNDVVLNVPQVSRYHAQIERVGKRFRVRDLRSTNGTFVNDQPIAGEVWLKEGDTIRIGAYRFEVGADSLEQFDESSGLRVEAIGLNKWVRKDLNILKDISVVFQPREFIVVVGQSGGGKSTLVDAIAGYRPATHGRVLVNGLDVYKNFDAIRNNIGFVPQKDIIHTELTPYQALDYAARLRMPPDTSKQERHQRVMEVLNDLDIAHRKDTQISGLSGGQLKRVSIGVELLTKPGLFFLDEPTSGLDPGTETALMQLMRRMADAGRTIVLITHATKNVMLADKVIFLARGGYLVWFGPPDEALAYFDQYRSQRDRRARSMEFDEIYAILEDTSKGTPEEWAERYKKHPAYRKYIASELAETTRPAKRTPAREAVAKPAAKPARKVSALRQFLILSARNLKILTRDRFSLFLMLAASPIVAMLDFVLSNVLGRNPYAFQNGKMADVLITLFLMTIYGVMLGGLSQMREIVKEADIYKRERLVNLKIIPYIGSKVWVAGLLALYQTFWYVLIRYLAFDMPGGTLEAVLIYISLALATMAGMMLGLFASALAPNSNSAPLLVILLMLPQIVLGGALIPLPEAISAPTSTRWAFQALMAITGAGSDVARDACWLLPEEIVDLMTIEDKTANCNCMGTNALKEESCNFPGMGEFYNPAVDQERPPDPPPEPTRPPDPVIPPPPPEPVDQSDTVAVAEYLAALQAYQTMVEQIQAETEAEFARFEAELEVYKAEVVAAQESIITWQIAQASAVEPAEGVIRQFYKDYGWTFVDKEDTAAYYSTLFTTWGAQGIIMGILFIAVLVLQKRKDVK